MLSSWAEIRSTYHGKQQFAVVATVKCAHAKYSCVAVVPDRSFRFVVDRSCMRAWRSPAYVPYRTRNAGPKRLSSRMAAELPSPEPIELAVTRDACQASGPVCSQVIRATGTGLSVPESVSIILRDVPVCRFGILCSGSLAAPPFVLL